MKRTTSGGTPARFFASAAMSPVCDVLDDLLLDRLADPLKLLRVAVERELRDRRRRLAHPARRAAVRDDAERLGAVELEQVGQEVELVRDLCVTRERRHSRDDTSVPKAVVCLPTYNERENLERMIEALAPLGVRVLVIDDNSPDGTGAIADRLAAERDWLSVLHRARKEGLGPRVRRGVPRGAGR